MTEALWGVVLGSVIASVLPIIHIVVDHKKWKKEKKLEVLRIKRDGLEKMFREIGSGLHEEMLKDSYSINRITDIVVLSPKPVKDAFDKMINDPRKNPNNMKMHNVDISKAMKTALTEIDDEIIKLVS